MVVVFEVQLTEELAFSERVPGATSKGVAPETSTPEKAIIAPAALSVLESRSII